jgi:D-inositol-3-phosphate glycosyltransferase
MEPQRRLLLSMGAIEHASHFGWENTARKTLEVYDLILTRKKPHQSTQIFNGLKLTTK